MAFATSSEKFNELYQKLNPQQREAVDAIEGPVMVIAGPGTGKTQILTLRIANILQKTDTAPENILALTFTEAGVHSMRKRLVDIIGTPGYTVCINTFHGFANDIIRHYPEEFPNIIGAEHITEVEQIKKVEEIILAASLKELKPFGEPLHYLRDILRAISQLKREAITPEKFARLIQKELADFETIPDLLHEKGAWKGKMKGEYIDLQKQLKKNEELATVYAAYESALRESRTYDYNDMIVQVIQALEANEDLLRTLQEQYQYLLVDEHQDTNNAQNRILELLSSFHPDPNLFVVGDEKQAIYRFQGASLENFLYFKNLYPSARLVVLEENYRSTQSILDSAHGVLAGEKKLSAKASHAQEAHKKIDLYAFNRPDTEAYFVAADIKKRIAAGAGSNGKTIDPSEIAVLYRDNRDAFSIAAMLERLAVPYIIESDQDVLADRDIRKLITLFYAVNNISDDEKIGAVLHIDFLGINPLDIYLLIREAHKRRTPIARIMSSKQTLDEIGIENVQGISRRADNLKQWSKLAKNEDILRSVETIIRESDFLAHILKSPDAVEKIQKLTALFDEMTRLVEEHKDYSLADFLGYLTTLESHNLLIKTGITAKDTNRVRLMTAHRSKGQEFEYVYIVNAYDGHWGNRRNREKIKIPASVFSKSGIKLPEDASNHDERRLFYVAITRAKKDVIITYATQNNSGEEQLPSQFIQDIDPELIDVKDASPYEHKLKDDQSIRFAPRVSGAPSIKEKEFVIGVLEEKGFSVSALNRFLKCPWEYFYNDILRLPRARSAPERYGTAIHAALQDMFNKLHTNEIEGASAKQFLLARFKSYMENEPLPSQQITELLVKGERALSGYYDTYHATWNTNVVTEFNIPSIMLGDIKLGGKIDKIEMLTPGATFATGGEVSVVDYKSGKPKTKNELAGLNKGSTGNEKRQLAFYNLLLDNFENKKYRMVSGVIDFLEPDDKGRYKREEFVITKEDCEALTALIKETVEKIRTLSFWNEQCDEKECGYCKLREMMG